jgi:hypothetical protein
MEAVALRRQQGQAVGRDDAGANATGTILATDRFGAPTLANTAVADRALQTPATARQTMEALYKALDDARRARLPTEQIEALSQRVGAARDALRGQFMERMRTAAATGSDILDAAGNVSRALSPAQFRQFWEANAPVAREIFEPSQMQALHRLAADFAESAATTRTAAPGGSHTAQNLSVGNLIARTTGGLVNPAEPVAQTIGSGAGLLRLLYSAPEEATRGLLAEALADPQAARRALSAVSGAGTARSAGYASGDLTDRLVRAGAITAGRAAERAAQPPTRGLLDAEDRRRRRGLLD